MSGSWSRESMGAILPWLVSQLGKSGTVKAGEEQLPPVHRRAGENGLGMAPRRDVHSSRIGHRAFSGTDGGLFRNRRSNP